MKTSIKLEGLENVVRGMKNLGEASQFRILRNASKAGANTVKRELKKAAPRGEKRSKASAKYGPLHKNIKIEQLRGKKFLPYYRVTTGDAFWGGFLDAGTKHIKSNFWFRNAVEQVRSRVIDSMVGNIRRSILREVAKIK